MTTTEAPRKSIGELLEDHAGVARALRRAARKARLDHKHSGHPICVWEDGKVVWIQPEDIPDDPNVDD